MNKEQATELIRKYNEGSASHEETRIVENWFVNQSEAAQLEPQDTDYVNVKKQMWSNIAGRVAQPVHKKIWWRSNIAAAAAVLVIAVAAALFYVGNKNETLPVIVKNDIRPGQNKAILTLADGSKISLTDAVSGEVAKQGGVRIRKTSNGQLIYQNPSKAPGIGPMEYNTIEAPRGGQWQVILPDGSRVFLNALSSLKYPVRFSDRERKVELNGEAYFEISHNKKLPFRVVAKDQIIEVLGTHFNVMAYSDEKMVKTTLLAGSVRVAVPNESLVLKPGEQSQTEKGNIKVVQGVDLEDVMAWKNGYFKFNENLEDVMAKVSRWYNVSVSYETAPDLYFKFKGEISRNKNLSELLKMLEYTGNVHFKIEGRRIIVTK